MPNWVSAEVAVEVRPAGTAAIRIVLVPATSTSVALDFVQPPVALEAGDSQTFAITATGDVRAWGDNFGGFLGDGTTTSPRLLPVAATALGTVTNLSAFYAHACLVSSAGALKCWGENEFGQLGDGTTTSRSTPVTAIASSVKKVTVGLNHSCALMSNGTVRCAGRAQQGQLGNGSSTDSPTFVNISSAERFTNISAGQHFTCAQTVDGEVRCWGLNLFGQLGNGTTTASNVPVAVSGLGGVEAVTSGDEHACARLGDGSAWCWGLNQWGALGDGTTTNRSNPVNKVQGVSNIVQLAAGGWFTCGINSFGDVYCWGYAEHGATGLGNGTNALTAKKVPSLSGALQVSAGRYHACARLADGSVWCWGHGRGGELGNGGTTIEYTPVRVTY